MRAIITDFIVIIIRNTAKITLFALAIHITYYDTNNDNSNINNDINDNIDDNGIYLTDNNNL